MIKDEWSESRIKNQNQDQEGWQGGAQRWRRTQSAAACMCSKAPISIGAFELVVQRSRQSVSLKTPSTAESATWRSCKPFCNCQNQLFQRNGQRYWPPRFELLSVRQKKSHQKYDEQKLNTSFGKPLFCEIGWHSVLDGKTKPRGPKRMWGKMWERI